MKDKIFQNLDFSAKPKGFLDILRWKLRSKSPKWPESVPLIANDKPPKRIDGDEIRISFVGHVTFLIQTQSLNILTDPSVVIKGKPV